MLYKLLTEGVNAIGHIDHVANRHLINKGNISTNGINVAKLIAKQHDHYQQQA